jgi:hypothetical protein
VPPTHFNILVDVMVFGALSLRPVKRKPGGAACEMVLEAVGCIGGELCLGEILRLTWWCSDGTDGVYKREDGSGLARELANSVVASREMVGWGCGWCGWDWK